MEVTPLEPRGIGMRLHLVRPVLQPGAAGEPPGMAELLLGAVMQATCGVASPVMMTVSAGGQLREGGHNLDARLTHAEGRQQRWLAELSQAGAIVAQAHVVLDGELPSSSYIPWRNGMLPATAEHDDGMAGYLAVARLSDRHAGLCAGGQASAPVWITVRYFADLERPENAPGPLTLSPVRKRCFGVLRQLEAEVFAAEARVAALTAVHEGEHVEA